MKRQAFNDGFTRFPINVSMNGPDYQNWYNKGRAAYSVLQGLHVLDDRCPIVYLVNRIKSRLRGSKEVYVWLRQNKVVTRAKDTQVDSAILVGVYTEITRDELRDDVIYSFLESFGGKL